MKNVYLKVVSPYLQGRMDKLIAKTGLSVRQMAEQCDLSYGYMRRIVAGTVLPNRDALKRLCDGMHLDFSQEWAATHKDRQWPLISGRRAGPEERILEDVSTSAADQPMDEDGEVTVRVTHAQAEASTALFRKELLRVFERMTFASKIELLQFAYHLELQQNDSMVV